MRLCVVLIAVAAWPAEAFCGFYVSSAGKPLFNDATQVVLMREGTRTVLTMQNAYSGPVEDFAMVVPVPVVLNKDNVRVVKKELFSRLQQLTAPRLVEYWEQDPCPKPDVGGLSGYGTVGYGSGGGGIALGVRVMAQFALAEYDIVVLSAEDALGLEQWLTEHGYKLPPNASEHLKPYIAQGMKFFVAKISAARVKFEAGRAVLSPLRFHYDAETFSLPVRLGLINSSGAQDLLVYVLAKGQRYEVANAPNVTIPTNLDVTPATKTRFQEFYARLFDETVAKHPGAIVTEYSWASSSCDPCSTSPLSGAELDDLGADVLPNPHVAPQLEVKNLEQLATNDRAEVLYQLHRLERSFLDRQRDRTTGFVLTRLHARYQPSAPADDLVLTAAPAIIGGREELSSDGVLMQGSGPSSTNQFQGRYAIRYPWPSPIRCKAPKRGQWGDRWNHADDGSEETITAISEIKTASGKPLRFFLESPAVELGLPGTKSAAGAPMQRKTKK